jgi:pilus assembly protein Flp/PilA
VRAIFIGVTDRLRRIDAERGATGVEYGLLVALIAAAIIATVATIGGPIVDAFQTVIDGLG